MRCPECQHENPEGVLACERCSHELGTPSADTPQDPSANSLAREPLSSLRPRTPVFVTPKASVSEAVDTMNRLDIGCVLVGSPEDLAGIFSERDLLFGVGERYEEVRGHPVAEFMTPAPETLESDAPLVDALGRMAAGGFRHVPVTREGRVVGVISLRDLLRIVHKWYPDLVG